MFEIPSIRSISLLAPQSLPFQSVQLACCGGNSQQLIALETSMTQCLIDQIEGFVHVYATKTEVVCANCSGITPIPRRLKNSGHDYEMFAGGNTSTRRMYSESKTQSVGKTPNFINPGSVSPFTFPVRRVDYDGSPRLQLDQDRLP